MMNLQTRTCWLALGLSGLLLVSCSSSSRSGPPSTDNRQQLRALFDEEWEYELKQSPETATALGDNRYNDRLDDYSEQAAQADIAEKQNFLTRLEAIRPAGLPQQEALSRELMIRNLKQEIEGAQFKPWEMPVDQMNGPHLSLVDMVTLMPFNNVHDYDNYLSRLHQIPRVLDQVTANMRQGMQYRLMPPRYLLEKVSRETQDIADKKGVTSPFAKPVEKFPAAISESDQKRLKTTITAAVDSEIAPAC
jgi:uncharacterized protein (DUF885 family)